jgi:DNA-binding LacI/PurR family transcriptional regulator
MIRSKAPKPKHQQVFDALSREILDGRYRTGQKFPSEAALVIRFQVSRITIGRALRELQQRGLVERVAGSGTYVRSSPAGMLFGLIIPDLGTTEIFEPICQAIAAAPNAAGHDLLWPHSGPSDTGKEEQAIRLCQQCIERSVSGVFFAPLEMTLRAAAVNRRILAALKKARIPTVLLDRRPDPASIGGRYDLVSIDNPRAGYLATRHLVKLGSRRIGFLAYRNQASSVAGRIAGYRRALGSRQEKLIFHVEGEAVEPPPGSSRCDAFVCSNDRVAGHLMRSLLAKGFRIPRDVRIVGIDDVNYASLLPIPLTTVHQPCRDIGEAALQALIDRIARPRSAAREILIDCELVIRESCGAGAPSA